MPFPILPFLPLGYSLVPTNTSLSLLLTPLLHWAIALSSGSVLELNTTPAHWAVISPCSITLGQSSVWGNLLDAVCMFWTALLVSLAVLLLLGCHSVLAFLSHTSPSSRAVPRVPTGTWSSFQQPPIIQRMCCCCRASLSTSQDLCGLGRNLPP